MSAVIFDLDGTLDHSMNDHFRAWKHSFNPYGIDLKPDDFFPFEGEKRLIWAKKLFADNEVEVADLDAFIKNKEWYYNKIHQFDPYKGVQTLLDELKKFNVQTAIVTSNRRNRVFDIVPKEFLDQFDVIVSGDDTEKGSPDPEPYMRALDELHCASSDAIVVENAPFGIDSAKASGIYTIGVEHTLPKEWLKSADKVVSAINQINVTDYLRILH